MTRVRLFQSLVVISTLLCVVWYALPYVPVTLAPDIESLLQANGAGGSQIVRESWFYNTHFAARLAAGVALLFFVWWGRWLLLLVLAIDLVSVLVGGVAVTPALDQSVYVLLYLSEGAVVTLAYSEPLASAFRRSAKAAPANEA
jgi:hypothetical protein